MAKAQLKYNGKTYDVRYVTKQNGKDIAVVNYSGKKGDLFGEFGDEIELSKADDYNFKVKEYAKGGGFENENALMVMNNNKQIKHHTIELNKVVNEKTQVPAWVVSKVHRSASDLSDATHFLEGKEGKFGKGSVVRANNSSLLRYATFEDNWHNNLLRLNPNRNQSGLKYKNANKYAVSRTSNKGKQEVFEFKTLEEAENKFNELVELSKTYSPLVKEGKTSNYAKGGNTPSNWSYSIGGL